MLRMCIIQDELMPGGKTGVIFKLIEILNKYDIIPDLYSYDTGKIANVTKSKNIQFNFKKVTDFGIKRFTYYKNYFLLRLISNKLQNYDFIFNSTHCLNKNIFPNKLVNYIHYLYPLEYSEPKFLKISLSRKLYLLPLRWLNRDHSRNKSKYGLVVANSSFTKKKIEEWYPSQKNKVQVIYPPVNIKYFWNEQNNRSNQVISVGNFEPQKDQLTQIKIAKFFPNIKFIITGFVNFKFRRDYYNKCLNYVKHLNVKNVILKPNLGKEELRLLLQKSKYFIHTRENEHFGISIVEAIAAGCIPLVHDSGGQREIVPFEIFRFRSIADAVIKFKKILKLDINYTRKKFQQYIQKFSEERFEDNIIRLIKHFYNTSR